MPRSSTTTTEYRTRRQRFIWPDAALNIWIFVMFGTAGVLIGVFASFINVQNHFDAGIPWIMPFGITVGGLTILFICLLLSLIFSRSLLPSTVIVLSIILFALYLTGLIETAIQLFGSGGNINGNCQTYVIGQPVSGRSLATLAWLEQQSICQSWYAVFAFWIIGSVFVVWLVVISAIVAQNQY